MTIISATTKRAQTYAVLPEIIEMLPTQGRWSEAYYLWLSDHARRLVEFTDGYLEVLPMPTEHHQTISIFLFELLRAVAKHIGGVVFYAPLRLRIRSGKFREPDILFLRSAADPRRDNRFWSGADLVVEIVSPDDPERDTVEKRLDYAEAGVPEYWIVNPLSNSITVLRLADNAYIEHGVFQRGDIATSALIADLRVDVDAALSAD